jgi:Sulfotransferase family
MSGNAISFEPALSLATWRDAERLFRACREAIVPVTEPLVLVSQIQRSGGTLINNLLDGHPELHVHPYELHVGYPGKSDWPVLDLSADPDSWLQILSEPRVGRLFEEGYLKHPGPRASGPPTELPFTVVPSFLEHLFRLLCDEREPRTPREVMDTYMTAFFNAWIDNQGLRETPKRWVTGFAPRVAWGESGQRFWADYPDGRLVSSLRDPRAWYASASHFKPGYADLGNSLALWKRGANEIATAKREAPDRVFVLTYEALVRDPKRVTVALADWLGIAWHPILLEPSFNRLPTVPNSSYGIPGHGVRTESLDMWSTVLDADAVSTIEEEALDLHAEVRALADVA